jgi:hypothetical protein
MDPPRVDARYVVRGGSGWVKPVVRLGLLGVGWVVGGGGDVGLDRLFGWGTQVVL